jgi:hypothetical protein
MTMTMSKFGWCLEDTKEQHGKCPKEFTNNIQNYTLKCDCDCHEQV